MFFLKRFFVNGWLQCAEFALEEEGGGGWEWVYDQPMYLQQNTFSQSINFSGVCCCGEFIFNRMVMTLFIAHIFMVNKTFLCIYYGSLKFGLISKILTS